MTAEERDQVKRQSLFVQPETKEDLARWIRLYLGKEYHLPDVTIDPDSTSNPMDLVWEIYSRAKAKDETLNSLLAYAAREAFKTLGSSIVELIIMVLLERNVAHMAAIETQAKKAQDYLKRFFRRPILREFITKSNERRIEFTRFKHKNGTVISPIEYAKLPPNEQEQFEEKTNYIVIVIATLQGANSEHVPFFVMDELDVAPPKPLEEAKMIPTQGDNGEPSITFMTSSRKGSFGPVQKEIDNAAKSGLQIRHWNIIDVTQACPTTRHRPDLPKIPIWTSSDELNAVSEEAYSLLGPKQKETYKKIEGYQGCLTNCKMFSSCLGRLATKQTSKSKLLKKIPEVQYKLGAVDIETAKAQLLCWKPSTEGSIYSRIDPERHKKTAAEIAEMITGDKYPESFDKLQLVQLMKSRDIDFFAGMDHGFTHYFAVVTGARDGNRMFIIDGIAEPELEVADKVERCKDRWTDTLGISPMVYADTEDPASNKTLSRFFKLRKWSKGPGSVIEGIQAMRAKLNPTFGRPPELYFLKGDPQVELLFQYLQRYHWKLDAAGEVTKEPDKTDDDFPDACRYLVMNVFDQAGKLVVAPEDPTQTSAGPASYTSNSWMSQKINELAGGQNQASEESGVAIKSKSGKFYFGA